MADLFSDGFESGDTSAWSSETDTETDLSVTEASALVGTYGLAALIDSTTAMYVTDLTPVAEKRYRCRFYFDVNTLNLPDVKNVTLFAGYNSSNTIQFWVKVVGKWITDAVYYTIEAGDYKDGAYGCNTSTYTITDAPHYIEVDWQASSAPGANDGFIELLIDGVSKETKSGIDSDTEQIDYIRFGAVAVSNVAITGTYYLDAFASNDDGGAIGGAGSPSASISSSPSASVSSSISSSPSASISASPSTSISSSPSTSPSASVSSSPSASISASPSTSASASPSSGIWAGLGMMISQYGGVSDAQYDDWVDILLANGIEELREIPAYTNAGWLASSKASVMGHS